MTDKPVLLVTTSTFPRWDGDSEPRFVYDLSTRLADTFQVIVVAPHAVNAPRHEIQAELHIYRYRYAPATLETLAYNGGITANLKKNRWKYLLLPGFFIGQWLMVRKLIKQHSVKAIHAHWLIPQGLVAVLAISGLKNKPALLCTSHGGDLYGLQGKFSKQLKRWVIQNAQAISVVSTPMTTIIQALGGDKTPPVQVIPMGTDLENTFVTDPTVKRLPNQLLFVGRLVEKKGIEYLLQALQEVHKTYPDIQLLIAGSGPLQNKLENISRQLGLIDKVEFIGRLSHQELVHLYQTSTLAVFPFVQAKDGDMEGLGLVMVEAMGCGCPVVASDLPAVRDVISHNENGYLVKPGNISVLTASIHTMLEQPDLRTQLIQNGLQTAQQHFDWRAITQRYQTLILRSFHIPIKMEAASA